MSSVFSTCWWICAARDNLVSRLSNGESDWEQGCAHDIIVIRLSIERCESKDQQSLLKAWQLPSSFFSSLIWVTLCTVWTATDSWLALNFSYKSVFQASQTDSYIPIKKGGHSLIIFWVGIWANTRPCFIYSITHNYICGLDTKLQTYYFPDPDCSKGG